MRILFLDDQPEILDIFRMVDNPALFNPKSQPGVEDLFAPDQSTGGDEGFTPVMDIEFKGSYFPGAKDAVTEFRKMAGSPARYQVAVLDMQLPESSGLEVAQELLALHPELSLMFVTAYSDWSIHDISRTLGMEQNQFMFLKKPFELQELLQNLLYIREKIKRELWEREALRNLVNFTRGYKVDSLNLFNTIMELKTLDLAKTLAGKRIPDLIQKNEKVLELVEMILTHDTSRVKNTFPIVDLLKDFQGRERVALEYDPTECHDLVLVGDRNLLHFALRCLINNGLDFSNGTVTVSASRNAQGQAEFVVLDRGIGIKREYFNEIFEPGFKLSQRSPKAGYGLSLVKRILLNFHKTELSIRSTMGEGTAIKFTLPCVPAA